MAEAPRDENRIPVLMGVSSADGTTPIPISVDPTTGRVLVETTVISSGNNDKIKISSADTTEGYGEDKFVAGSSGLLTITKLNTGGNEQLEFDITGVVTSDELAKVSSNDTTGGFLNGKLVAGTNISLTENNDGSNETLTIAVTGLGTIATQDANNVNITGGTISGVGISSLTSPLAISDGGTGGATATAGFDNLSPLTTLGDMIYRDGSNNVRLAGNVTTTKQFLSQTGDGVNSAAPAWAALAASDMPSGIDATKIGGGSVDNTEFSYLNNVTSNIQTQLNGKASTSHASTHIRGGSDVIDADQLTISYSPTLYTPDTSPTEVSNAEHLTAHLAGLEAELGNLDSELGTGTDGAKTVSGTETLTRDMHWSSLTVPAGTTLVTNGYKVYVNGTTTVDSGGVIENDGNPGGNGAAGANGTGAGIAAGGTGGTAGAATNTGTIAGGVAGVAGGDGGYGADHNGIGGSTAAQNGSAGNTGNNNSRCINTTAGADGTAGGDGADRDASYVASAGQRGANAGATASGGTNASVIMNPIESYTPMYMLHDYQDDTPVQPSPGSASGSGGGGGGAVATGGANGAGGAGGGAGGSGSSGGIVALFTKTLVNNGVIRSHGGAGGNGGDGGDAHAQDGGGGTAAAAGGGGGAGGSGGNGGAVLIARRTTSGSGTITVTGGAGGTGGTGGAGKNGDGGAGINNIGANGSDGNAGNAGVVRHIPL